MPDWTENKLYVSGADHAISALRTQIESEYNQMVKTCESKPLKPKTKGQCTHWNADKGYGFIVSDSDDNYLIFDDYDRHGDIFVHCSEIHANGPRILSKGETVEFDIVVQPDGRKKAINVTGPGGSYVEGSYAFYGGIAKNNRRITNIKLQCCGLQCIDKRGENHQISDKTSAQRPLAPTNCNDMVGNGIIYIFSTTFTPPREWLRIIASKHSTLNFKLMFQNENPEAYGYIMYENGKMVKQYDIEEYTLIQQNLDEFEELLRNEIQCIFNTAVQKHLVQYGFCPNLQTTLLGFCPQYLMEGLLYQFIKIWDRYDNDKEYKVETGSVFFDLFSKMENKLNAIFAQKEIEILAKWSIRHYFWGQEYGQFNEIYKNLMNE